VRRSIPAKIIYTSKFLLGVIPTSNYFGRGKIVAGYKKLWNCFSENGTVLGLMWKKYYGWECQLYSYNAISSIERGRNCSSGNGLGSVPNTVGGTVKCVTKTEPEKKIVISRRYVNAKAPPLRNLLWGSGLSLRNSWMTQFWQERTTPATAKRAAR